MKKTFYSLSKPEDPSSAAMQELRKLLSVPDAPAATRVRISDAREEFRLPHLTEGDVWIPQMVWWSTLAERIASHETAAILRPSKKSILGHRRYETDSLTMIGDVTSNLTSGNWLTPTCGALVLTKERGTKGRQEILCTFAVAPIEDGFGALIWATSEALEELSLDCWFRGEWCISAAEGHTAQ
ncbi:MAG: hypothetical protein H6712_35410 [Myxococcales bacterium]|nr:hypothetical protein [Myxococcales bacterium]